MPLFIQVTSTRFHMTRILPAGLSEGPGTLPVLRNRDHANTGLGIHDFWVICGDLDYHPTNIGPFKLSESLVRTLPRNLKPIPESQSPPPRANSSKRSPSRSLASAGRRAEAKQPWARNALWACPAAVACRVLHSGGGGRGRRRKGGEGG
jgi:hypothetical protein